MGCTWPSPACGYICGKIGVLEFKVNIETVLDRLKKSSNKKVSFFLHITNLLLKFSFTDGSQVVGGGQLKLKVDPSVGVFVGIRTIPVSKPV